MKMYKSIYLFLILFSARLLQLLQLYFTSTPSGGSLSERALITFICAVIVEGSVYAGIVFLYTLFSLNRSKKWPSLFYTLFASVGLFYLSVSAINDQVMRWMGQHFDLAFIKTYSLSKLEPGLVNNIFLSGLKSFVLSVLILFMAAVFLFFISKKISFKKASPLSFAFTTVSLLTILILSSTATSWNKACRIRWKRIQPLVATWYYDIKYDLTHKNKPDDYTLGIQELGGNPNSDYPLYHYVANEDSSLEAFKSKPLIERPDIILLSLESLRGWASDFRIAENCKRMPNLCSLALSGSFFPYTYSVGFPSTEGMTGLQLGIWSHPQKVFLTDFVSTSIRPLPEILGDAGYYRLFLTAAEPSFDNFTPWFDKWADYHEYKEENSSDIPLAHRFVELYNNRPKDKPLYSIWINFTTHTPFNVPKSYATPASTSEERYKQTLAYLDSAIGIVLNAVREDPRFHETIIIATGDHSIANTAAQKASFKNGNAFAGQTWTTMTWSGYKIPQKNKILHPISHVNFAPTILSLLGLSVSNHFVGEPLFNNENNHQKVFSFRRGGIARRQDSIICFTDLDLSIPTLYKRQNTYIDWDSTNTIEGFASEPDYEYPDQLKGLENKARAAAESWRYILDHNKLYPPK